MPKYPKCVNPKCKKAIGYTLERDEFGSTGEWICLACGTIQSEAQKDTLDSQLLDPQFRQGNIGFADVNTGDGLAGKTHRQKTGLQQDNELGGTLSEEDKRNIPDFKNRPRIVGPLKHIPQAQILSVDERRIQNNRSKFYRILQTFDRDLPELTDYMKDDVRTLLDLASKKFAKKRNRNHLVAACIYCSSKKQQRPISLDRLCDVLLKFNDNPTIEEKRLVQKHVMRIYKQLVKKLELDTYNTKFETKESSTKLQIETELNRGCSRFFGENRNIQAQIYQKSLEIYEFSHEKMLDSGKDPVGFAASIFYFVTTKSGISEYGFQTKVCDIFNVPRQTLNRNYKAIMNAIGSVSLA